MQDNYAIQAAQAKQRFLSYDQAALIAKLNLPHDEDYLYPVFFNLTYRLHRQTGDLQKQGNGQWADANTFAEVMTLLDLICDCSPTRHPARRWKSMTAFGLTFHRSLIEPAKDPWAEKFQEDPASFHRACQALGGTPLNIGDLSYSLPVFDTLEVALQLWFGDDEFPPTLRLLWDENALQYLKYETMHFAKGFLFARLAEAL